MTVLEYNVVMDMLHIFGLLIGFIALCLTLGFSPNRPRLSRFERKHRSQISDPAAILQDNQAKYYQTIQSVKYIKLAILIIFSFIITTDEMALWQAVLIVLFLLLLAGWTARVRPIHKIIQKIYNLWEQKLIKIFQKYPFLAMSLQLETREHEPENLAHSRQELLHIVDSSPGVLSIEQKKLVHGAIELDTRQVVDYMTPRDQIEGIERGELLGPLVLDDLHKTGHSRFPVIAGDLDHIVGMLYIHDLLALKNHQSANAAKAMDPSVYYVHQSQTLKHALVAMLKTKQHLLVVVNEFMETTGLISMEDILESLMGAKIIDEFRNHDNLAAVAKRPVGESLKVYRHDI